MTLQETIRNNFMKSKNPKIKMSYKYIISEFSRQKEKHLPDDKVLLILKKIKKKELEYLKYIKKENSNLIEVINEYLPKQLSDDEVKKWILSNIDITQFNPPIKAINRILSQLINTNGNQVKKIIKQICNK